MIKLSSFEGGGGYFSIESRVDSSLTLSVGVLLSLPEVGGKVYKIDNLSNTGYAGQITNGITFIADGIALLDNQPIYGSGGINTVTKNSSTGSLFNTIFCKSFSIIGETGVSGRPLTCLYQIGSFK